MNTSSSESSEHSSTEPSVDAEAPGQQSYEAHSPDWSIDGLPIADSLAVGGGIAGSTGDMPIVDEGSPVQQTTGLAPAQGSILPGDTVPIVPISDPGLHEADVSPQPASDELAGTESANGEPPADAGHEVAEVGDDGLRKGGRPKLFPKLPDDEMRAIWDELTSLKKRGDEIEIEAVATNRGGVVASYRGVEVFVPVSHWTLDRHSAAVISSVRPGDKANAHILEITAFDTDARRVTASRRTVLRREMMQGIQPGSRMTGRVVSVLDFGVFVNIGGVDGLLPASEMSYDRASRPIDLFEKGQVVEVVVKDVDRDKKRIYLSRKELLPTPWGGVEERFAVGTVHTGKVVGIGRDGAFVQLEPGVDGFLRAGELSWTRRVASPRDVLQKGDDIEVMVLEVSERRQRVSLSYRQAHEDPWPALAATYAVGTSWEGTATTISNKGVVVAIDDIEGFLPRSRMGRESRRLPDMKVGEKLNVSVLEIEPTNHSLILGLAIGEEEVDGGANEARGRRPGGRSEGRTDHRRGDDRARMPALQPVNELKSSDTVTSFALGDLIGDAVKARLRHGDTNEGKASEAVGEPPHSAVGGPQGGDLPDERASGVERLVDDSSILQSGNVSGVVNPVTDELADAGASDSTYAAGDVDAVVHQAGEQDPANQHDVVGSSDNVPGADDAETTGGTQVS